MCENEVEKLKQQLKVARDEISNLRIQINNLTHVHRKDIESIKLLIHHPKTENLPQTSDEPKKVAIDNQIPCKPIGYIRTVFAAKKAVPRQANLASITSRIELCKDLYTNPEQSLETLEEFSHIWIIYHFHRNDSHLKPKVSPPRLDGKKVGVYATRCPHRPNPIGISLVKLDKIEGSTIYFLGGDMVDETPVIDIKPYIPAYDNPQIWSQPSTPTRNLREEPEGEEDDEEIAQALPPKNSQQNVKDSSNVVTTPRWINDKKPLEVTFADCVMQQMEELHISKRTISDILQQDPRSVYVREKFCSQIYNFQVDGNNVICKFDDANGSVNVLQVRRSMAMN